MTSVLFSRDCFNPSAVVYNNTHALFVARHLKMKENIWISSVVYGWLDITNFQVSGYRVLLDSSKFSTCAHQKKGARVKERLRIEQES